MSTPPLSAVTPRWHRATRWLHGLIAHVLIAVWHEYKGERLIAMMFRG